MLEIFRGIRASNGKWVYGDLCHNSRSEVKWIMPWDNTEPIFYDIYPETAGQYIGLNDDNDNKIYKDDILHLSCNNGEWYALVEFGNPNCCYSWGWQLKRIKGDEFNEDILLWVETEIDNVTCEVIGNIHDNPSLLGGA